ncbi:putative NAD(P)H quinone oxidoreductase, PIG3 family [Desulfacinum hydrothermale DSM 13146]|uniref:Putative NAD(P)H quinone oxidoreductase, PIG3 family n=1 Tax=Desulfacinum hydrothermale DSM 13146 TaxID=1121390 RepID=A0A1W1WZK7_9BACT|nr:NAD(P)H-quinone oxidoreductase [Desulfacinum hydrothermale]SMC17033.1 putative NAD(P)H quinone oxidoreductase, PIG3 family [Desulfacinum hydrothermale DSM 13146]
MEATMPAVVVRETEGKGGWNALELARVPRPVVPSGEVLVQVEACSVNRADLLQRRGLYPPPPGAPDIPGLDLAGYVVEGGPTQVSWQQGDRVFGVVAGGGYGRYCAVPAEHLLPIPDNLSFVEAAAAAEVFVVAHLNLFLEAGLGPGERLLLHGGGSGVGTAAIQLAKARGAQVAVTCGEAWKIKRCRTLGADLAVCYRDEDFWDALRRWSGNRGVDVVLDWIGAPYLERHLDLLALRGRLVFIGLMGGHQAHFSLAPLLTKRLRLVGSVLRSRSREEKAKILSDFQHHVLPLLARGDVKPVVDRIFPIAEAEAAHRYLKDGKHFGKIVLCWKDDGGRHGADLV